MPASTTRHASTTRQASIARIARGVDLTPPSISSLSSSGIGDTAATISFLTNESATSELQYATDAGFTSPTTVPVSTTFKASHSVGLTGLTAATTYYYRARATDVHGNQSAYTTAQTLLTTGGGGDSWVDSGTLSGITLQTLNLEATIETVLIEMPFAESGNLITSITGQFRPTLAPSTVRNVFDQLSLVRTGQFGGYAAIRGLDPATSYDVRLTITDNNGFMALRVGTVTTQIDFNGDPADLVPTHYVNPVTGLDTFNGTTSGTAWKTLDKAIAVANAGAQDMVILLSAHSHKRSTTVVKPANSRKITLTGFNDVVTLGGSPGDRIREVLPVAGSHTVVYSGFAAGPTGCPAGDLVAAGGPVTAVAPWVQDTPDGNGAHILWKWVGTGFPAYQPWQMCYDSTVNGTSPKRLPQWKKVTTDLDTPAKFANIVYDCQEQSYGFYNDPTGLDTIYVRMPGDANPNNFYFWIGGDQGVAPPKGAFQISGNDVRVCRIETRATDCLASLDGPAQRPIVDHNIAYVTKGGAAYDRWTSGATGGYVTDELVQYNRAQDSELWKLDRTGISWKFIKEFIHRVSTGAQFSTATKIGGASEATGIYGVKAGRRATIRYNTVVGHFNGIGTNNDSAPDRYAGYGRHVHHNLIMNGCDDGFEPENNSMLWVIELNRVEQMFSGFSTGPVNYGPLYIFANEFYRINSMGISDALTHAIYTAALHKFSQNSNPEALCYVLYNTVFCDQVDGVGNAVSGGEKFASGASIAEATYWIGNILRFTKDCYDFPQASPAPGAAGSQLRHDDYNAWGTSDPSTTRGLSVAAGLAIGGSHHYLTIANYRTATGQGAHTNHFGGVDHDLLDPSWIDAALNDPTNGDLTLKAGSVFINAGIPIDNFMDRPGVDYFGLLPDLGATQTTDEGIMGGLAALLS